MKLEPSGKDVVTTSTPLSQIPLISLTNKQNISHSGCLNECQHLRFSDDYNESLVAEATPYVVFYLMEFPK